MYSEDTSDPTILPTLTVVQSALHSQTASMVGLAEGGDWNAVQLRLANQIRPLELSTSALVERVDREVKTEQAEAGINIRQAQNRIFFLVPVTVLLTLLIAGTLGLAITRSITRPWSAWSRAQRCWRAESSNTRWLSTGQTNWLVWGAYSTIRPDDCRTSMKACREARTSFDASSIPFPRTWSTLPDGSVDFINQRLLESTGLFEDKLLGSGWLSIVHPDDSRRFINEWASSLAVGEPVEIEARIWTARQDYRWLLIRNVPLRDSLGNIIKWYGTGIDIEARKFAEEALRKAQADLAHANRVTTMGELSASLAHEINQPISGAVTNASTCLRWLKRRSASTSEGAQAAASKMIRSDVNRAAEIISRVRLFFRKGIVTKELIDVNEVIREMELLLRHEAREHSVSVYTKLAGNLPLIVADRIQLQQVLMNLMINAIDAMKTVDGPRHLTLHSQRNDDGQLLVSVDDTGVGLPRDQASQIFNAFFTTKEYGTGMGLRISQTIIEAHGGRLWATDNDPRGASFHFTVAADSKVSIC